MASRSVLSPCPGPDDALTPPELPHLCLILTNALPHAVSGSLANAAALSKHLPRRKLRCKILV
jgi:hypothetical protein